MMVKCPDCGNEFDSSMYSACPECGCPVMNEKIVMTNDMNDRAIPNMPMYNNTSQYDQHEKKHNTIQLVLLGIIALGIVYLGITQYRQTNRSNLLGSSNRVLIVELSDTEKDVSDNTQIQNALENGGMLRLNVDNLDRSFKLTIEPFAAHNSGNYYFVLGAILNYVASEGWNLVQGPSSGLSNMYFFIR